MVFCTYCGQSFTRDEHLERHILTRMSSSFLIPKSQCWRACKLTYQIPDTNVKPFKCFTCHMSFARRDLLQRHYTVHGKDANNQDIVPAANGMIPRSAGRTPIACSNCAKTKTKCDKKFPCSRCSARNLKCTLRPTRRATKTAIRVAGEPEAAGSATSSNEAPAAHESSEDGVMKDSPGSPTQHGPVAIAPASPKSLSPDGASQPQTTSASPAMAQMNMPAPATSPMVATDSLSSATPVDSAFVPSSTITGLADLSQMGAGHPGDPNSRFILDWTQMQTPMHYENMIQPQMMVSPDMTFDVHSFPMPPHHDGMISMMPDLNHNLASSLITPIETPKIVQRHMSEIALGGSIGSHSISSNRHHSYSHPHHMHPPMGPPPQSEYPFAGDEGEMAAIIAAQDAWSVFRCGPTIPSASCPKTALPNLERLRRTLGNYSEWSVWSPSFDEADMLANEALTVMQVHESSRDKLFAVSQSFLQKAFEIHGRGAAFPDLAPTFPPAHVLSYFIRAYANCFERYFPLTPKGTVCVNELLHCHNNSLAASLLVLMMIAQGAVDIPSPSARMLTGGLTEVCRISLFDLIEKNINLASDHTVLHAALLFTVQAAWSGDKWQMDIAMGQRGMYFAMLRHSGALGHLNLGHSAKAHPPNTDRLWCDWIDNEKRSRLVYSWVMVDQDIALFHDCAPLFSVSEFAAPMPDADRLWHANTAIEWSSIFEQVHEFSGGFSSVGSGARPLSLSQLFRHFLNDELIPLGIEMTPLQLRLLLHPLQSLLSQFNQLLSCFSDPLSDRNENIPRKVSASSTRNRVEEVQSLLGKWYDLAERYLKANPICPMMQTNLVIFHLVSLNAVTDFPEIERLARGEIMSINYQQLLRTHKRCIFDVGEAVYHCGQVFRLVRSMPRNTRPPWWAGAIYRVALVLWTDSQMVKEDPPANNGMYPVSGPCFPIDRLMPEHTLIIRYLTKGEGSPCVTKRDGSQLSIDRPLPLLRHCVDVIDEGASTRFSDGIRSKLEGLLARGA